MAKPFKSDLSLDAKLAAHQRFEQNLLKQGLTKQQVVEMERKLAKFANTMDSVVRIPFTNQGVGADAALSTVPIAGDVAGLLLTGYAFMLGIKLGVPAKKLTPAVRLAMIDLVVGVVPVAGTVMDVFLRPSRKTLQIVREHMQQEYGITDTTHVDRPFMHQALQKKQQQAKFWRNPLVAWLYLHVPDILGLIVLILLGVALWAMLSWIMGWVL
ncbi:DUF4112 domain-containing protein [Psychrobacter sp. H7-1]|uniref:DUF4112 domain-containing protein n=1 Tax=Psychrobacter sp. H7-1 TaxID=1569265 RepID=UPI0019193E1C|nr:DUF4112 domain-containing protein [Psychrobacter sp. H7-1]